MKLLVDMNLSPSWLDRLARHGFEAFHWSSRGAANAPDDEILTPGRQYNLVVLTYDLDFSAILAAGGIDGCPYQKLASCWNRCCCSRRWVTF